MNEQLDFWSNDQSCDEEFIANGLESTQTCAAASASYLVPWFLALKASAQYTRESKTRRFTTQAMVESYRLFGMISGWSFEKWWGARGHLRLGWVAQLPHVQMHCRKRKGALCSSTTTIDLGQEKAHVIQQLAVLLDILARYREGELSSCPQCWAWFHCLTPAHRMCHYLEVFQSVEQISSEQRGRYLEVGTDMHLVPKARIKPGDSSLEIRDKRIAISKTTYEYWSCGKAIVDAANQGIFPPKQRSTG